MAELEGIQRQKWAEQRQAQELAERLLTAAQLHQAGKLEKVEPELARALGKVARMKGYEVLKRVELAQQLENPAVRRAYLEMLKPHEQAIERQRSRERGRSR